MKDLTNYVGFFFKKGGKSKKGSGIHIKKSHEGLFTKKAKAAGYGVQEYARHVLANKGSYDSATVKQAVFAHNAAGFKHELGGVLRPILKGQLGLQVPGKYIDDVRLDFSRFIPDKVDGKERYVNPDNMSKIQDMLIEAGIPYTQRVAILSTILQESGGNPNAMSETGKYRGLLQWDSTRMPTVLSLEDQVKKIIDEINDVNAGQFTDGGSGGPYAATAKSGREQFMKSTDPYAATVLFNKTYVRPKEQQSWYNRANQAAAIHNILGGLNDQKLNESWSMPDWVYGMEQTGGYGYKSPEPVGQFGRGGRVIPFWKEGAQTQSSSNPLSLYLDLQKKIDIVNAGLRGLNLSSEERAKIVQTLWDSWYEPSLSYDQADSILKEILGYRNPIDKATISLIHHAFNNMCEAMGDIWTIEDIGMNGEYPATHLVHDSEDPDDMFISLEMNPKDTYATQNINYIKAHHSIEDYPFDLGNKYLKLYNQNVHLSSRENTSLVQNPSNSKTEDLQSSSKSNPKTINPYGAPGHIPVYNHPVFGPNIKYANGDPTKPSKYETVPAANELSTEDLAYKDSLMRSLYPENYVGVEEVEEPEKVALTRHQAKRTNNGKKVRLDGKRVQLAQSVGRGYQNMSRKGTENRDYIVWTNNEI